MIKETSTAVNTLVPASSLGPLCTTPSGSSPQTKDINGRASSGAGPRALPSYMTNCRLREAVWQALLPL
jgi:hypothetical protein